MTLRRLDKAFAHSSAREGWSNTGFSASSRWGVFPASASKPWRRLALHTQRWLETWQPAPSGVVRFVPVARPPGRRDSGVGHPAPRWSLVFVADRGWPAQNAVGRPMAPWPMTGAWSASLSGVTHTGSWRTSTTRAGGNRDQNHPVASVCKPSQANNRQPNRRKKAVRRLAAARAKVARKRLDWAHQQTAALARQICLGGERKNSRSRTR